MGFLAVPSYLIVRPSSMPEINVALVRMNPMFALSRRRLPVNCEAEVSIINITLALLRKRGGLGRLWQLVGFWGLEQVSIVSTIVLRMLFHQQQAVHTVLFLLWTAVIVRTYSWIQISSVNVYVASTVQQTRSNSCLTSHNKKALKLSNFTSLIWKQNEWGERHAAKASANCDW